MKQAFVEASEPGIKKFTELAAFLELRGCPNVMQLLDIVITEVSRDDGGPNCAPAGYVLSIVMPKGSTDALRFRTNNTPLPLDVLMHIVQRIGIGLEAMHRAGGDKVSVTHRDFKTNNLVLSGESEQRYPDAYITDFGMSKVGRHGAEDLTFATVKDFTNRFRALELERYDITKAMLDLNAVDAWAFGQTVHELLYGDVTHAECFNERGIGSRLTAEGKLRPWDFPASESTDKPIAPARVRDFIKQLLEEDPTKRLGSKNRPLTSHPVMQEDWTKSEYALKAAVWLLAKPPPKVDAVAPPPPDMNLVEPPPPELPAAVAPLALVVAPPPEEAKEQDDGDGEEGADMVDDDEAALPADAAAAAIGAAREASRHVDAPAVAGAGLPLLDDAAADVAPAAADDARVGAPAVAGAAAPLLSDAAADGDGDHPMTDEAGNAPLVHNSEGAKPKKKKRKHVTFAPSSFHVQPPPAPRNNDSGGDEDGDDAGDEKAQPLSRAFLKSEVPCEDGDDAAPPSPNVAVPPPAVLTPMPNLAHHQHPPSGALHAPHAPEHGVPHSPHTVLAPPAAAMAPTAQQPPWTVQSGPSASSRSALSRAADNMTDYDNYDDMQQPHLSRASGVQPSYSSRAKSGPLTSPNDLASDSPLFDIDYDDDIFDYTDDDLKMPSDHPSSGANANGAVATGANAIGAVASGGSGANDNATGAVAIDMNASGAVANGAVASGGVASGGSGANENATGTVAMGMNASGAVANGPNAGTGSGGSDGTHNASASGVSRLGKRGSMSSPRGGGVLAVNVDLGGDDDLGLQGEESPKKKRKQSDDGVSEGFPWPNKFGGPGDEDDEDEDGDANMAAGDGSGSSA